MHFKEKEKGHLDGHALVAISASPFLGGNSKKSKKKSQVAFVKI
jgi:hypothetical protein